MEKDHRVFCTMDRAHGVMDEAHGGGDTTNACTGFMTKEAAEVMANFFATTCTKFGERYEARRARA